MGIGITNAGGGGTSLNFEVKAYPTKEALLAATPRANTIGIITENKITSWAFDFTEPSAPTEGMVWVTVGNSSVVEFNALKKNGIQVYPLSAKQYISGAWVDKTAMSYQNGKWVDWIQYLYKTGTLYPPLTSAITKTLSTTTINFNSNSITYYDNNSNSNIGGFAFDNMIDVSNYNILRVKCRVSFSTTATEKYKFGISKAKSTSASNMVAVSYIPYSDNAVYVECQISSYSGEYYLVFACGGASDPSTRYVEIEEIIVE